MPPKKKEAAPKTASKTTKKTSTKKATPKKAASNAKKTPERPNYAERLEALRKYMDRYEIDACIIPSNDQYLGEYVPDSDKRLQWLTGFTGSSGLAIIHRNGEAAFFTDGRYVLQAKEEVDEKSFARFNSATTSPEEWVEAVLEDNERLSIDPWLHSENNLRRYTENGTIIRPLLRNPIDDLWEDRPLSPCEPIYPHPVEFSGKLSSEKRQEIASTLEENDTDYLILTAPDSICWLLNLRGNDVPNTPLIHCSALLSKSGNVMLFIDRRKIDSDLKEILQEQVILIDTDPAPNHPIHQIFENCSGNQVTFQLDPDTTPYWFTKQLVHHELTIVRKPDPCQLAKACKNETELDGAYHAHVRDGIALTKFFTWLSEQKQTTELEASTQLETFRKAEEQYQSPSFDTISAFGEHGAIIHYKATEETNATIKSAGLYLVDSGAQYRDGTTDVTRTIAIGKPTKEQISHYTTVLKAHIALATATFPVGTTGSQLDSIARQHLWNQGIDYDHGTGHGVGSFLGVHEGPARISKSPSRVPLQPGMIFSNEPGYYKPGEYGIRIENLLTVAKHDEHENFLTFHILTMCPYDRKLIDKKQLTKPELEWINAYHSFVEETLLESLESKTDKDTIKWLKAACKSL